MTGFLQRLADVAIGEPVPESAVPDLPPRFSARAPAREEAESSPAVPAAPSRGSTPVPAHPGRLAFAPAAPAPSADRVAQPPAPQRPSAPEGPAASTPTVGWASTSPSGVAGSAAAFVTPAVTRAPIGRDAEPPRRAPAGTLPMPPPLGLVPRRAPIQHAPTRSSPARPHAPLSEVALASRVTPRQEPVVVQVTIDRLEVRAPAASRPTPEPPRRRPEPSVALADFLRGAEGRRP
jgi:hypothetical protein